MTTACADTRPDVLLITIDTLRADHLHSYGFPLETSPRLDALAARGVLFERAIAAAASTVPAHASIMTSRYPREHSVGHRNGGTRLEGHATLAAIFAANGYATAAFVGNLVLDRRTGLDHGFDVYDDELNRREKSRYSFERIAVDTVRSSLAWLATSRAPVFLWVHYQDPHGPYAAPDAWRGRFPIAPGRDEQPLPVVPGAAGLGGIPEYQALDGLFLPSQYRARYAEEIAYADHWIGALLDAFDARTGDPVVLVTADHGESLGERKRWFVHFFGSTPENAHVPMILRAPGVPPGRRPELVGHVDVLPTLLELAGIEPPPGHRGIALGPFLRAGQPLPERTLFCDTGREVSAYRGEGFVRVPVREGEPARGEAFDWRRDGVWVATGQGVELPAPVVDYTRTATPVAEAPLLSPETRARLRALGYEPE